VKKSQVYRRNESHLVRQLRQPFRSQIYDARQFPTLLALSVQPAGHTGRSSLRELHPEWQATSVKLLVDTCQTINFGIKCRYSLLRLLHRRESRSQN
jgi:hypothetical protein